jgi:hypothetical protein
MLRPPFTCVTTGSSYAPPADCLPRGLPFLAAPAYRAFAHTVCAVTPLLRILGVVAAVDGAGAVYRSMARSVLRAFA